MKKYISQIAVALVCVILGFLLTYQFKLLNNQEKDMVKNNYNSQDLTSEIEQLKKEKIEYEKKNNETLQQLKKYEEAATSNNDITKELKKQLDDTRLLIGSVDVEGPGITVYLTPKSNIFSSNLAAQYLTDSELVYIINELNYSGAEAISINDKRVTIQSGIKSSGGNSFILINDERISPRERITIKAIGNKENLLAAMNFPGALEFQGLPSYDKDIKETDKIKIPKFSKIYKNEYMKPVK
ncbi:DUF881 domain-containing protein [Clostridium hydrogeniformans]|uniref:DUF881 domain-containing protein n=1 Tax=Clostridium hydrogeniformans TaxID=349933 RepID=UPI00048207BB|nr:DUF881 domain-containing protein [Clostridium hydrogeniformans]